MQISIGQSGNRVAREEEEEERSPLLLQAFFNTPPNQSPHEAPPSCEDTISINDKWDTIYCDNFDDNRNEWAAVNRMNSRAVFT